MSIRKLLVALAVVGAVMIISTLISACTLQSSTNTMQRLRVAMPGAQTTTDPTSDPGASPMPTLTPSRTLKPPPTFEPPTATFFPSPTPTITPTPTLNLDVSIPGLRGAETPTPSTTPGCEPRDDWQLTYTVQANDALARIAERYGTYASDLAAGNCLSDANVIRVGQVLKVPGDAQPYEPEVECVPFELLTPVNGTLAIEGEGTITFNWRGPRAPRNLIRIHRPDGTTYEVVIELRQNEPIDLYENLWLGGTYTWYVYPLDSNFVQACPEGGPWTFTKEQSPTATPTPTPSPTMPSQQQGTQQQPTMGPTIIVVTATPTTEPPPEEPPAEEPPSGEEPSAEQPPPDTGGDTTGTDTTGSEGT